MTDPTPLNAAELAAVRARCEAATPGPWICDGIEPYAAHEESSPTGHVVCICNADWRSSDQNKANAIFVAHTITDIPRLLKTIEAREKRISATEDLLKHAEMRAQNWQTDAEVAETQRDGLLAALDKVVAYIERITPFLPNSLYRAEAMHVCAEAAEAYYAEKGIDTAGDHDCHPAPGKQP